jgi:hypothetical protein
VRYVREGRRKSSDIEFEDARGQIMHCEVKSLGISDDEICRRSSRKVYDGMVYFILKEEFLNKLHKAIDSAWTQIHSRGTDGLVFILITFDDIALDHYKRHRKQLITSLRSRRQSNLFIKIGLLGNKRIPITTWK